MIAMTKTFAEQIVDLERGLRLFKRCVWAFVWRCAGRCSGIPVHGNDGRYALTEPCFICGETECACWDVCRCGDYRSEHDSITRRSTYNTECFGFEFDPQGTVLNLTFPEEQEST
jgi:hypothetical protein